MKRQAALWNLVFAVALSVYSAMYPRLQLWKPESHLAALLVDRDWFFIALFGLGNVVLGVIALIATGRSEHNVRSVVEYLHRRAFPTPGHIDDKYRVSIFVATRKLSWPWPLWRRLHCWHRTNGRLPRRSWDLEGTEGLVPRVYQTRVAQSCRGLTRSSLEAVKNGKHPWPSAHSLEIERHLKDSCSTPELLKDTSWGGVSMLGIPVLKSPTMECLGVLLVECNDGNDIPLTTELYADASLFAIILEESI